MNTVTIMDAHGATRTCTTREARELERIGAVVQLEDGYSTVGDWDDDAIADQLDYYHQQDAEIRELRGIPDDTPSLANCDDAGTGEGRFHGRM